MTLWMRSWKILFDVSVYSKIKIVILLSLCWRCIPFSVHLSIHTTSFRVSQMSKVHKETVWNLSLKIHSIQNWNIKTSKNVPLAASTHGMKQATSSKYIRLFFPIWKEVPALQTEPRHTASYPFISVFWLKGSNSKSTGSTAAIGLMCNPRQSYNIGSLTPKRHGFLMRLHYVFWFNKEVYKEIITLTSQGLATANNMVHCFQYPPCKICSLAYHPTGPYYSGASSQEHVPWETQLPLSADARLT